MRMTLCRLFALAVTFAASATAQKPATLSDYANEAYVVERMDREVVFHADGTGDRTVHTVVKTNNEAGARQLSVLSLGFASANEDAEITGVRVTKADGRTVETPFTDAVEMPAAVSREAPLYSDLKEKQLPVRSISGGDTLEYTFHVHARVPQAPGQFWGAENLTHTGMVVRAETLTLRVPAGKYVQVWSPSIKPEVSEAAGEKRYVWKSSQLKPTAQKDNKSNTDDADDDTKDDENLPDLAWTTFKSWAELGDWYRSLSHDRIAPSDELKANTQRLIADAKTPEEKIRKIYSYVATRTRYVGIDLGIGRYQPHDAMTVFSNQYGDCKDKDTLLEAMLNSAGFATAPVLIGVSIDLSPDVPSPGFFNHVITQVQMPSGSTTNTVWLDSTPELAPFGYLLSPIRGKQALVIPTSGQAHLEKSPENPPYALTWDFKAEGTLDTESHMKAHIDSTLRDDSEVQMRAAIRNVPPAKWDYLSQLLSSGLGFGGTTSHSSFSRAEDTDKPVEMSWDYDRPTYGDIESHLIVPLLNVMSIPYVDDKKAPKRDIDLGVRRREHSLSTIHLPAGYYVELPDPIHVKNEWVEFDKVYRFDKGTVTTERSTVVLQSKVPKAEWKRYVAFQKSASLGEEKWIRVHEPSKPVRLIVNNGEKASNAKPETTKAEPIAPEATVDELRQQAAAKFQARDFVGAKRIIEEIMRRSPDAPRVHAMLGSIAGATGDMKTFEAEMLKEVEISPNDPQIVIMLAELQSRESDEKAEKTLLDHVNQLGTNEQYAATLARIQSKLKHHQQSIPLLKAAVEANPESVGLKDLYSNALIAAGDKQGAAAMAKAMLASASDDAGALNSAAYSLAEAGADLPLAEEKARHAVDLLEARTAAVHITEANERAFSQSSLLVATWDTLGWILYLENKQAEAEPYLRAAWLGEANVETGLHLGKVLEGHDPAAAITTYQQAKHTDGASSRPEIMARIDERLTALHADLEARGAADSLQNLRMMKVTRPAGLTGWGTYRVQLGTNGVVDLQLIQGDDKLRSLDVGLKKLKFPAGTIPAASKAVLLKNAVVSCHSSVSCDVVFMTKSGTQREQVQ